jgi:hypothetical protein
LAIEIVTHTEREDIAKENIDECCNRKWYPPGYYHEQVVEIIEDTFEYSTTASQSSPSHDDSSM